MATGRPVETDISTKRARAGEQVDVWPSILGGKNWEPGSFNPQTGTLPMPTRSTSAATTRPCRPSTRPANGLLGMDLTLGWAYPEGPRGYPQSHRSDDRQGQVGSVRAIIPRFSGVLSTAGGGGLLGPADRRIRGL